MKVGGADGRNKDECGSDEEDEEEEEEEELDDLGIGLASPTPPRFCNDEGEEEEE